MNLPVAARNLGPGPLTKVRRHSDRATYDATLVYGIVDEALICHVSAALDGQAFVIPTVHARRGDSIYLHGAAANHMLRGIAKSGSCCLAFTLIDGLVFARTAFHHSMNYRSVIAFGSVTEITDRTEKHEALALIVEHIAPGRMQETAAPTEGELKSTLVIRVDIAEASAKVRSGPPVDDPECVEQSPHWAGVLPLRVTAGEITPDPALRVDPTVPGAVASRARSFG